MSYVVEDIAALYDECRRIMPTFQLVVRAPEDFPGLKAIGVVTWRAEYGGLEFMSGAAMTGKPEDDVHLLHNLMKQARETLDLAAGWVS